MADGMIDPFAPIRQAQQNLNQTLATIPQLKAQRLENQVRKLELENALTELAQKKAVQQDVQQQRQQFGAQQQLGQGLRRQQAGQDVQMAPPQVSMGGQQRQRAASQLPQGAMSGQQRVNALSQLPGPQEQFPSSRAELEAWARRDPDKARKKMQEEVKATLEIAKISPERAEKRWKKLTGEDVKLQEQEADNWWKVETDEGVFRVNEQTGEAKPVTYGGDSLKTEPGTERRTLYNIKDPNKTKRVEIKKGETYIPPPGWTLSKPSGAGDKKPSEEKALRRTSQIRKAILDLNKTNEVTQAIVAANPALKDMLGKELDEDRKQDLLDSWQNELDYYEDYLPEGARTPKDSEPDYDTDDPMGLFQ